MLFNHEARVRDEKDLHKMFYKINKGYEYR